MGGSDENNFFSDAPNIDNDYSYDIRIDHKFSDKQSIFGHVDFFNNYILYGAVFGQPSLTPQQFTTITFPDATSWSIIRG